MKALSIKQPWLVAILTGQKTIETRVWSTKYRGDILLVASKRPDKKMLDALKLQGMDFTEQTLAYGKAVAIATIVDCRPMTKADEEEAMCDIYPNAFAWVLEDVKRIEPFPVKGQLGIYEVEYDASISD